MAKPDPKLDNIAEGVQATIVSLCQTWSPEQLATMARYSDRSMLDKMRSGQIPSAVLHWLSLCQSLTRYGVTEAGDLCFVPGYTHTRAAASLPVEINYMFEDNLCDWTEHFHEMRRSTEGRDFVEAWHQFEQMEHDMRTIRAELLAIMGCSLTVTAPNLETVSAAESGALLGGDGQ